MKNHYYLICFWLLAFITSPLSAETIEVSSYCSPNPLSTHSIASYTIIIKGSTKVALPHLPPVAGLDIHFLGKGHSVQIINGQKQTELRLNYALKAKAPGTYTLPKLILNVENKPYELPSTSLTVVPSAENDILKQGGISLSLKASQDRLYVGQTLSCQVVLKVPSGIQGSILSDKPLLSSESLQERDNLPPQKEAHNPATGFQEIIWERTLKASQAGTYGLSYELPLSLRIQSTKSRLNSLWEDHFLDPLSLFQSQDEEVLLRTPEHTLDVLELPTEGRPRTFSGYIGTLRAQVIETSVMDPEVGDPVTLKLILTGSGDLENLAPPSLQPHKGVKSYPPKEKLIPEPPPSKLSSKVIEYILIPQEAGRLDLAPLEINFFNPDRGTYEQLKCSIPSLLVQPSSMPYQSPKLAEDSLKSVDTASASTLANSAQASHASPLTAATLQTHLGKLSASILPSFMWSKSYWRAQLIGFTIIGCISLCRLCYVRKQKQCSKLKTSDLLKALLEEAKQAASQEDPLRFFCSLEQILRLSSRCTHTEESLKNLESFLSDHRAPAEVLSIARQLWELGESYNFGGDMSHPIKLEQAYEHLLLFSNFLHTCLP